MGQQIIPGPPTAFLFEAKDDELDRLTQPELVCLDSNSLQSSHRSEECETNETPARMLVEFDQMQPQFPRDKRGLYFFRTRPEAPFFGSRQYGMALVSPVPIRRKISISMRLDKSPLPDFELDHIESRLTLIFVPNEPAKLANLTSGSSLWLMWRHRSFSLLPSQSDEISLSGIELLELDSAQGRDSAVVRFGYRNSSQLQSAGPVAQASGSGLRFGSWPSLARNRWYKFERAS